MSAKDLEDIQPDPSDFSLDHNSIDTQVINQLIYRGLEKTMVGKYRQLK